MAFQPVPLTAMCTWHMTLQGEPIQFSAYFAKIGGWTETDLTTLAENGIAWWTTNLASLTTNGLILVDVEARDLAVEFGAVATVVSGATGSSAAAAGPASVAAWVKFVGSPGSAPREGGIFVPGLLESQYTFSFLDTTYREALDTIFEGFEAAMTDTLTSVTWVIVSRYSIAANPTPPHKRASGVTNPVSAAVTRSLVGAQRNRRPGQ